MANRRVKVFIDADTKGLNRGLRGAENSLGKLGKRAVGAAAGFVGVAGAISEVKKSVGVVSTLAKGTAGLARVTGMEVQEASRWVAVTRARGIEAQKLTVGFTTLSKQITAANNGTKASAKAFKDLGVSQKTLASGNTSKIIAEVSDGMAKLGPGAERSALASKLFGKSYAALLPMLADGSAKLNENLALSDKYGLTLNGKTSKAALEAAKNQREMNMAMDGLRVSLGVAVIPFLSKAAGGIASFIANLRNGKGQAGDFGRVVKSVWDGARRAVANFVQGMNLSRQDVSNALAALKTVFRALRPVVETVVNRISERMRNIGRVVGGVVKIVSSIIRGDWKGAWNGAKQVVSAAIDNVKSTLRNATAPIRKIGSTLGKALWSGFKSAVSTVGDLGKSIANAVIKLLNSAIPNRIPIPGAPDINFPDNPIPSFASGGRVPKSPMQLVGERGPELVSLPAGSYVHNATRTRAMLSNGAVVDAFEKGGRVSKMVGRAVGISNKRMKYQYGGYGNPSYDCSGYWSAIMNAGGYNWGRLTTVSFRPKLARGKGKNVTIGIRGGAGKTGHMMGAIRHKGRWRFFEAGGRGPVGEYGGWNGSFEWYHPHDDATLGSGDPGEDRKASRPRFGSSIVAGRGLSGSGLSTSAFTSATGNGSRSASGSISGGGLGAAWGTGGDDGGSGSEPSGPSDAALLAQAISEQTAFAKSVHSAYKSVTDTTLDNILDRSLGGTLSQMMLTLGPRMAT